MDNVTSRRIFRCDPEAFANFCDFSGIQAPAFIKVKGGVRIRAPRSSYRTLLRLIDALETQDRISAKLGAAMAKAENDMCRKIDLLVQQVKQAETSKQAPPIKRRETFKRAA